MAIPVSVVPPICYLCLASTAGTRAVQRGAASRCNCARHIRFPVPERTCPAMHHTKQRWCSSSSSGPRTIASAGPYARSSGVIFSLSLTSFSGQWTTERSDSLLQMSPSGVLSRDCMTASVVGRMAWAARRSDALSSSGHRALLADAVGMFDSHVSVLFLFLSLSLVRAHASVNSLCPLTDGPFRTPDSPVALCTCCETVRDARYSQHLLKVS